MHATSDMIEAMAMALHEQELNRGFAEGDWTIQNEYYKQAKRERVKVIWGAAMLAMPPETTTDVGVIVESDGTGLSADIGVVHKF